MSHHEPGSTSAGITLPAHVEELRSRCEAVSRLQGGSTYLYEEIGIFNNYVRERGLRLETPPAELSRPPDDEGNEHQVWFLQDEEAVLKVTWPDFFGVPAVHSSKNDGNRQSCSSRNFPTLSRSHKLATSMISGFPSMETVSKDEGRRRIPHSDWYRVGKLVVGKFCFCYSCPSSALEQTIGHSSVRRRAAHLSHRPAGPAPLGSPARHRCQTLPLAPKF